MEAKIHKPVLIVIAGPNGSGKATITSRVLHHEWLEDSIYINPDNIAQKEQRTTLSPPFTRNYMTHKTLNKKVKGEGLKTLFYIYARQGKNERVP